MLNQKINIQKYIFSIIIMAVMASGYAIEGNWNVISLGDMSLADQNITLQISDYIFRKNTIHQKIVFRGCKQFILQASIQQNQIFFNTNTYQQQQIEGRTCPKSNPLDTIFKNLKVVFYFSINIDRLIFNDPFARSIIMFKRIINTNTVDVSGIWTLGQYGNTRTSLAVEISPEQLIFCQGNSVYNYTLNSKTRAIELIPIVSNCPSTDLIKSLESSRYFRFRNGILNLFDVNVTLTVQLIYSKEYDPRQPTFIVPLQSNKNQTINQISPTNLVEVWQIKSLFKIPFKNSKYSLQFTKTKLKVSGGCANYEYNYKLDSNKQIITIQQIRSNNASLTRCAQSDDQLYVNGVLKMYKYLLISLNGTQILNFYDNNGQIGYSLAIQPKKITTTATITTTPAKPASTIQIQPVNVNGPFTPGRYLLLLLQRRDLPRVSINIIDNTINFKRCNDIVHTFELDKQSSANSKITIKGGPTTKNKCIGDTDQIYYGNLNLVRSFTYDAAFGVIILKNAGGIQIISLSKS